MRELAAFFAAVWKDFVALVSGLASVILTFIGLFGTAVSPRIVWTAVVACAVLTGYRVWVVEHRERVRLEAKASSGGRFDVLDSAFSDIKREVTGAMQAI